MSVAPSDGGELAVVAFVDGAPEVWVVTRGGRREILIGRGHSPRWRLGS